MPPAGERVSAVNKCRDASSAGGQKSGRPSCSGFDREKKYYGKSIIRELCCIAIYLTQCSNRPVPLFFNHFGEPIGIGHDQPVLLADHDFPARQVAEDAGNRFAGGRDAGGDLGMDRDG